MFRLRNARPHLLARRTSKGSSLGGGGGTIPANSLYFVARRLGAQEGYETGPDEVQECFAEVLTAVLVAPCQVCHPIKVSCLVSNKK